MKQLIGFIIVLFFTSAFAQDSTAFYIGWGKPSSAVFAPRDSMRNQQHTQIKIVDDKPVLLKRYDADNLLFEHLENEYDQYGNHIVQKIYYNNGKLREENIFRNDPTELAIFRTIFGSTFNPANSNFLIRREYNDYGRETGYFVIGIQGRPICSRITIYRDDRRKDREILRDDLKQTILTERRYKYIDNENRTILEEFNAQGKMVQRVVLFDHNDIIQN
ncbi:MAG: hypothetical protein U9Q77_03190 [Candidatus Marinimicrobia bacterium]|nr:hypothetical protein [Candidatus Neomarinimicrobiota bacterium]